jgi:endogenous inhibitor of DNA gyrase (YacG/DUF329 family)
MIVARCPICGREMEGGKPAEWPQFPFCSPRCKTIDLGRWLNEDYRIATGDEEEPPDGNAEQETP